LWALLPFRKQTQSCKLRLLEIFRNISAWQQDNRVPYTLRHACTHATKRYNKGIMSKRRVAWQTKSATRSRGGILAYCHSAKKSNNSFLRTFLLLLLSYSI
jgi:hypothetical protein